MSIIGWYKKELCAMFASSLLVILTVIVALVTAILINASAQSVRAFEGTDLDERPLNSLVSPSHKG